MASSDMQGLTLICDVNRMVVMCARVIRLREGIDKANVMLLKK